jgi:hypothetical protein
MNTDELITKYSQKASGYYREIIDGTAEPKFTAVNNVVVVGQFRNGPFMKPTKCEDITTLHAIFGNRDSKLEAKGNFGMLIAEQVIEAGAIWVLNLKDIDQYNETLQVKKFAVNSSERDALVSEKIATVYDTSKFWKVDKQYGTHGIDVTPSLSFASVLQNTVTIVVEKIWSSNYNYTVADTKKYNPGFMGDNLNDDDFVNDFLVKVHVFHCNLMTAKLSVANAIVNGQVNLSKIEEIQKDTNANYFATYTGTIGDVIDINGTNMSVITKMNADTPASGVYAALNYDTIGEHGIDLIGKQAIQFDGAGGALPTSVETSRLGYTFTPELKPICVYMKNDNGIIGYTYGDNDIAVGTVIANELGTCRVIAKRYVDNAYTLPVGIVLGGATYPIMPDGTAFPANTAGMRVYPASSPKAGQQVQMNQTQAKLVASMNNDQWLATDTLTLAYTLNGVAGTVVTSAIADATHAAEALQAALMAKAELAGMNFKVTFTNVDTTLTLTIATVSFPDDMHDFAFGVLTSSNNQTIVATDSNIAAINAVAWFYQEYVKQTAKVSAVATGIDTAEPCTVVINMSMNGNAADDIIVETAASDAGTVQTALVAAINAFNAKYGITMTGTVALQNTDELLFNLEITDMPKNTAEISFMGFTVNGTSLAMTPVGGAPMTASYLLTTKSHDITVSADNTTVTCNGVTNDIDTDAVAAAYGEATKIYELTLSDQMTSILTTGLPIPVSHGGTWGQAMTQVINGNIVSCTPYCFEYMMSWSENLTLAGINPIQGIVSLEKHYVNGTVNRQEQILNRLTDNWCMQCFEDPTIFRARYMVDTFKCYIAPNQKWQYAKLADNSKRFLCFVSSPFYYELRTSKNPDFHNILGEFDMDYVANGSNPDKPSTNSFSFVQDSDTSKYLVAAMNVEYNDGFAPKIIPSTGVVAKAYYSKLSGTKKVYDIVAGDAFPLSATGVVGPEIEEVGENDRKAMEKCGINVIQKINGVMQLRSSLTVYQSVLSAFNYPESLEKCFYVSDAVEPTLAGKIFKYNSADARLAVKKKADAVCDVMVTDGAISDYENKCDLENNPVELRKHGIILLDTILYNEYGIRIAVHRTTIKDPEA